MFMINWKMSKSCKLKKEIFNAVYDEKKTDDNLIFLDNRIGSKCRFIRSQPFYSFCHQNALHLINTLPKISVDDIQCLH